MDYLVVLVPLVVFALVFLAPTMAQWAIPVVVLMGVAWLFRSRLWRIAASQLGYGPSESLSDKAKRKADEFWANRGDPPIKKDYRAAGVDTRTCTKCGKQLKTLGYYFGLATGPTVYCPSCWSKATDPNFMERYDKHFESLTTKVDTRKPM
jgi:hypothetical protein